MLSQAEKSFIIEGIKEGVRNDGRRPHQYRELVLQTGVLQQASGSASCKLGSTEVLVAVKADLGVPFSDTPELGGIQFAVDISPGATQLKDSKPDSLGLSLARNLQRSIRWEECGPGCAIDLRTLGIVSGKSCWVLSVDGLVLDFDGNLLDALSIAVKAALNDLKIPHIEVSMAEEGEEPELELNDDPEQAASLDTSRVPIFVTVSKAGSASVVDLTEDEELACGHQALQVAVTSSGTVNCVAKKGRAAIHSNQVLEMVETAQTLGVQIHKALKPHILAATRNH